MRYKRGTLRRNGFRSFSRPYEPSYYARCVSEAERERMAHDAHRGRNERLLRRLRELGNYPPDGEQPLPLEECLALVRAMPQAELCLYL
jgi:hypothetical protein